MSCHPLSSPASRRALAASLCIVAAACDSAARPIDPVATLRLTPATDTLYVGDELGLLDSAFDGSGDRVHGAAPRWRSTNAAVVSVDQRGRARASAVGAAAITATSGGATASARLAVGLKLKSLQLGDTVGCGVDAQQVTWCFRPGRFPMLGRDTLDSRINGEMPRPVPGAPAFRVVAAGATHACGLTAAGDAYCWGRNQEGQLGRGFRTTVGPPVLATPERVSGGVTFDTIDAGGRPLDEESCALTADGLAYCWGAGRYGRLGNGEVHGEAAPTPVSTDVLFRQLSVGGDHVCAVATNTVIYCWGSDVYGQLGVSSPGWCATANNAVRCATRPTPITDTPPFATVAAGDAHTCALTPSGEAYCWGANMFGQLGNGATADQSETPQPVAGGHRYVALSSGGGTTCGLTAGGAIECWGASLGGQPGTAADEACSFSGWDYPCHRAPTLVSGTYRFRTVAASGGGVCGLRADDALICWGSPRLPFRDR